MNNVYKIILLISAVIFFAAALYVYHPVNNKLIRITVVGDSQTKIAPDTAVITFSVVTQDKQALNSQQENARISENVKKAVEEATENDKPEVKTGDYSLNPEQDYYSGKMPKILGYEVKNTVTVSVKNMARVGAVIDAATKAGANSVEGIQFAVGETSTAQGDATALATKQAMAKAEAVAQSLNGKIVRVVESTEGGMPIQSQTLMENGYAMNSNMTEAKRAYTTPVQAGSLNVRSQVLLVVEAAAAN